MKKNELKSLIHECLNEVLTDQTFDELRNNIGSTTILGEKWHKMLYALEGVYEEVRDFEAIYRSSISREGKPANIQESVKRIEQIVALLQTLKPAIISMDKIQKLDMMS